MDDSKSKKRPIDKFWLRGVFPVVTFLVIAIVGQQVIHDEPFRTIWVPVSGFMALVIWFVIDRYLSLSAEQERLRIRWVEVTRAVAWHDPVE